jgi:hypothetical protein
MRDPPKNQLRFQWRYLGLIVGGFLAFIRDPDQWILNGFMDKAVLAGVGFLIGGLVEIGIKYRDRLKFSIRDLLLLTTIVAVAAGWWVDHRSMVRNTHVTWTEERPAKMEGTSIIVEVAMHEVSFQANLFWPLALAAAALGGFAVVGWLVVRFKFIPQFGIRELLWLLTLGTVLAAWWVDHGKLATERQAFEHFRPLIDKDSSLPSSG